MNSGKGLYGRSENRKDIKRTYIQGMGPSRQEDNNIVEVLKDNRNILLKLQQRPIAGLLYSVSRDVCGEIFPVYVGRNTIGSSPASDVYLNEETVSDEHAVLLIRSLVDKDGKRVVTMNITDSGSEFGTAVNGKGLDYDRANLKGNDIIQIGNSYFFLFIPLDPSAYGLGQVEGFCSTERVSNLELPVNPNVVLSAEEYIPIRMKNEPICPSVVGEADERTFYGRSFAKKEDHSSNKTIN